MFVNADTIIACVEHDIHDENFQVLQTNLMNQQEPLV